MPDRPTHTDDEAVQIRRLVDFKLPLHWILSGVGTVVLILIGMWFTIGQMSKDMTELQVLVKALATANSTYDREVYRLQFRQDSMDAKVNEISNRVNALSDHRTPPTKER